VLERLAKFDKMVVLESFHSGTTIISVLETKD